MINLAFLNGEVFIWNADDWLTLREKYHMTGNLIGTLGCLPRQDSFLGLPVLLMHEEARLLLDKKLAKLVQYESLTKVPSSDLKRKFEEFREKSYLEQVEFFQSERKKQITNMVDIIVEGKRRKLMGLSNKKRRKRSKQNIATEGERLAASEIPDRDVLVSQEFNKVTPIPKEVALIQTPTACPWLESQDSGTEVPLSFPCTQDEGLRARVFADLWEQGLFITPGHKFGGHFLVYPGDPIKFHAQYIVVCRSSHSVMQASELVALGRLGTSVRKSVVLATLGARGEESGEVVYHTITWTA